MYKSYSEVQQIVRLKRALTEAILRIENSQEILPLESHTATTALFSLNNAVGPANSNPNSGNLLTGILNSEARVATGRLLVRHQWQTLHRFGSADPKIVESAFKAAGLEVPLIVGFFHAEYWKLLSEKKVQETQVVLCAA